MTRYDFEDFKNYFKWHSNRFPLYIISYFDYFTHTWLALIVTKYDYLWGQCMWYLCWNVWFAYNIDIISLAGDIRNAWLCYFNRRTGQFFVWQNEHWTSSIRTFIGTSISPSKYITVPFTHSTSMVLKVNVHVYT